MIAVVGARRLGACALEVAGKPGPDHVRSPMPEAGLWQTMYTGDPGEVGMSAAPRMYPKHEDESCWTPDYLLRHCEGYRVDSPDGHLGYVEEVVLLPDESQTIGFLVREAEGVVFVSVRQIRDFSPGAERIVVDPHLLASRPAPWLRGDAEPRNANARGRGGSRRTKSRERRA